MSDSEPSSSVPASTQRRWPIRWSVGLNIAGSLILAVIGTFLSDYVKGWLSNYSANIKHEQINSLRDQLALQEVLHSQISQYVFYVGELALKASVLSVILSIFIALYGVAIQSVDELDFLAGKFKYRKIVLLTLGIIYAIVTVSVSLAVFSYYRSALDTTHFQRTYDSSRAEVTQRLNELQNTSK